MLKSLITAIASLCALAINPASAKGRHHGAANVRCVESGSVMFPVCGMGATPTPDRREARRVAPGEAAVRSLGFGAVQPRERRERLHVAQMGRGEVIGGRPAGCPHAFCGCGASLHLFGRIIPSLNLAANWLRFPRAAPAPRMAAARRGHVMVLEEHIEGDVWLVHDSNSGHGATRLHARSIAGYTIVNPNGAV